jgi:hypothetical protein
VHVGVVVLVIILERFKNFSRFLGGCSAVEVDQRLTVCLLVEDRKILTDSLPIDVCSSNLVHGLICSVQYDMPIYSETVAADFARAPQSGVLVCPAGLQPAESHSGQYVRYATRAQPYVPTCCAYVTCFPTVSLGASTDALRHQLHQILKMNGLCIWQISLHARGASLL